MKEPSIQDDYGAVWDRYVKETFPRIQSAAPNTQRHLEKWRVLNTKDETYGWPGDEWGDQETTEHLFDVSLTAALDTEPAYLCELGSGAGRYTYVALERFARAQILSFDVSAQFEKVLRERYEEHIRSGRLKTFLLNESPRCVVDCVGRAELLGRIDAVYSFDAMVHVDLHTLFVYWLSAATVLRPGGVLAMNVADACSENGFLKLMHDAAGVYRARGQAGGHFFWISRDVVQASLERLGFEVQYPKGNGRDLFFSATLVDKSRGLSWMQESGARWLEKWPRVGE